MGTPIIARMIRGRLLFQVRDVLFPTFSQAACAWSAAEAHRLDIAEPHDELIVERAAALAEMRGAGDDLAAFKVASKREAALSADIRRLRRAGGVA